MRLILYCLCSISFLSLYSMSHNLSQKMQDIVRDGNVTELNRILESSLRNKNPQDVDGVTPLHVAAECHALNMMPMILKNGVNVDVASSRGVTPLLHASSMGNPDAVDLLLVYGADITKHDAHGRTAIHEAVYGWKPALASTYGIQEKPHKQWHNVLHKLLDYAQSTMSFQRLCQLINKQDHNGATPLHIALDRKQYSMALWLLEYGAHPDIRDAQHYNTPLHIAIKKRAPLFVILQLLQHSFTVNLPNKKGEVPLHVAITKNISDCVQAVLVAGGDPNICMMQQGGTCISPLHMALSVEGSSTLEMLLQMGAASDVYLGRHHKKASYQQKSHTATRYGACEPVIDRAIRKGIDKLIICLAYGYDWNGSLALQVPQPIQNMVNDSSLEQSGMSSYDTIRTCIARGQVHRAMQNIQKDPNFDTHAHEICVHAALYDWRIMYFLCSRDMLPRGRIKQALCMLRSRGHEESAQSLLDTCRRVYGHMWGSQCQTRGKSWEDAHVDIAHPMLSPTVRARGWLRMDKTISPGS